ncbi:VOC family protein [Nocardia aobensis]|uniref:VOC family protein n=1 Tax=Nocardia aobensis TaxID=257277 RepID=A0ABW6NZV2_9NOCA
MNDLHDPHADLHSEHGAFAGEHPGRALNPIVKVHDLAWLEFEKRDLVGAEKFATAFGFTTIMRTPAELHLRGADAGSPCVIIRRGARSRFVGPAFSVADRKDLARFSAATGAAAAPLPESLGGVSVDVADPGGLRVRLVSDTDVHAELPAQPPHTLNVGRALARANRGQRPPREPSRVQRLGHVVVQTTKYRQTLDWYLQYLGMIVSDFQYYRGQRDRGPVMSFIRCDRGRTPADHHTLALVLGPRNRYVHSAYQVADLDALAAGGEYLRDSGYRRSWGIGRHFQGSQLFDYWRDPDGFLVEHFTDGDMFDCTVEPGWAPMTASGLAQWGPPVSRDFLGISPSREMLREARAALGALRDDNEFDLRRLRGLLKAASS